MKNLKVAAILVSTLLALYLAAAGWTRVEWQTTLKQTRTAAKLESPVIWDGVPFASSQERDNFLARKKAEEYFAWTLGLPASISLFISAMSFAYLGGIINLLLRLAYPDPRLKQPYMALLLSPMVGLLILAASIVIPSALTFSEVTVRPVVLLFLCLLGGMFSKYVIGIIEERFEKAFDLQTKKKGGTI